MEKFKAGDLVKCVSKFGDYKPGVTYLVIREANHVVIKNHHSIASNHIANHALVIDHFELAKPRKRYSDWEHA